VTRIQSQGIDLSVVKDRFVHLERLARGIPRVTKLSAWFRSRTSWSSLERAKVPPTAAILFTSGSEALPKAVPLTHENLLANLRDAMAVLTVRADDRLLSFLPPFHSFGLTAGILAPLCCGMSAAHCPNPTDGAAVARHAEAYRTSLVFGTPTFLSGMVRAGTAEQLASLRLAVTGAEKCSRRVYAALKQRCPNMTILEGYGMTECSPIVSVNDENAPQAFTIGKVFPSLEWAIADAETGRPVARGEGGVLLVRGPSVFDGYLSYDGPSPFVEFQGKTWYRTGDLVSADADGVLTFRGRLKRFVKLGGEMISLPAVEAVLEAAFAGETDEGPVLAVEATPEEEHPEIVLFASRPIDREEANRRIRDAGLSALHNIRRVMRLESIPLLGTGKTDYRELRRILANEPR
jgi:long-chain-fatty-acid--[acyl-carrier-protein] ligase